MAETQKEKQDAAVAAFVANQERLRKASEAAVEAARKAAEEKAQSATGETSQPA